MNRRLNRNQNLHTNTNIKNIVKNRLLLVCFIMLILFILLQLFTLGIFSAKGEELSNILSEQKQIESESKVITSQINDLESINRIQEIAYNSLGLTKVKDVRSVTVNPNLSQVIK